MVFVVARGGLAAPSFCASRRTILPSDVFVAGTAVFGARDYAEAIAALRRAAAG